MAGPETSVIIPVRNGARYLRQAIESVLAQLRPDDEVLVVDNMSEDDSWAIAAGFAPRVTLFKCDTLGPSAPRNVGLRNFRGRFVAFLDHDDLWPEGRHAALLEALRQNPQATHAIGRIVLTWERELARPSLEILSGKILPWLSLMPSLFRRELMERVGLFDETLKLGEDADYIVRIRHAGGVHIPVDVDALYYRQHDSNSTFAPGTAAAGMINTIHAHLRRRRMSAAKSAEPK